MEKGLPLSKSEKNAVKKLAKTHERNEKALEVFAKVNALVKPKPKPITKLLFYCFSTNSNIDTSE